MSAQRQPEFPWGRLGILLLLACWWLAFGRPYVLDAQAQPPGRPIFADGFESGDTSCWPNGCPEPEPEYPRTCGPGNVQENLSPLEDNGDGTCSWLASCAKGGTTLTARVTQPCDGGGR